MSFFFKRKQATSPRSNVSSITASTAPGQSGAATQEQPDKTHVGMFWIAINQGYVDLNDAASHHARSLSVCTNVKKTKIEICDGVQRYLYSRAVANKDPDAQDTIKLVDEILKDMLEVCK